MPSERDYEFRFRVKTTHRERGANYSLCNQVSSIKAIIRYSSMDRDFKTWEILDQETGSFVKGVFPCPLSKFEPVLKSLLSQPSLPLGDIC